MRTVRVKERWQRREWGQTAHPLRLTDIMAERNWWKRDSGGTKAPVPPKTSTASLLALATPLGHAAWSVSCFSLQSWENLYSAADCKTKSLLMEIKNTSRGWQFKGPTYQTLFYIQFLSHWKQFQVTNKWVQVGTCLHVFDANISPRKPRNWRWSV